jgi:hypothetical protein
VHTRDLIRHSALTRKWIDCRRRRARFPRGAKATRSSSLSGTVLGRNWPRSAAFCQVSWPKYRLLRERIPRKLFRLLAGASAGRAVDGYGSFQACDPPRGVPATLLGRLQRRMGCGARVASPVVWSLGASSCRDLGMGPHARGHPGGARRRGRRGGREIRGSTVPQLSESLWAAGIPAAGFVMPNAFSPTPSIISLARAEGLG